MKKKLLWIIAALVLCVLCVVAIVILQRDSGEHDHDHGDSEMPQDSSSQSFQAICSPRARI